MSSGRADVGVQQRGGRKVGEPLPQKVLTLRPKGAWISRIPGDKSAQISNVQGTASAADLSETLISEDLGNCVFGEHFS